MSPSVQKCFLIVSFSSFVRLEKISRFEFHFLSTGVGVRFHLRDKLATIFAPEPKTKQQQQKTAPDFNQLRPMRSNHYLRLNTCQAIFCCGRSKDELCGSGCHTGVEHRPTLQTLEVMGSNPARCWAFFSFSIAQ